MIRLAAKFVIVLALTSILLMLGSQVVTSISMHHVVSQRVLSLMKGPIKRITRDLSQADPSDRGQEIIRLQRRFDYSIALLPVSRENWPHVIDRDPQHDSPTAYFDSLDRPIIVIPIDSTQFVTVGPIADPSFDQSRTEFVIPWVAWILVVLVGAAIGTTYPMVRRLFKLQQAANKMSQGELSVRIPNTAKDAIGRLCNSFNDMAETIENQVESQRQLLHAVSHELRSPLARLQFHLELMRSTTNSSKRTEHEQAIDEDLDLLEETLEELLAFVRCGEKHVPLEMQALNPVQTLTSVADSVFKSAEHISIEIDADPSIDTIWVDPRHFRRSMRNLLLNAARFARQRIVISLRQAGRQRVAIDLSDDGPGIPVELRERIFEPFARAEDNRNRHSGGVGLGLAIVKASVLRHGGEISVDQSQMGGARFVTLWPTSRNQQLTQKTE